VYSLLYGSTARARFNADTVAANILTISDLWDYLGLPAIPSTLANS